jgi:heme exporter protein B
VLLSSLLAVQRSSGIEAADGVADAQRLSGLDPAGIFLGKAAAVAVQLAGLEVILGIGVVLLYDVHLKGVGILVATAVAATVGLAAAGTLYGVLAAGLRVRETLLPLLLLPVVAPVLIAATRASENALTGFASEVAPAAWLRLLAVFAVVYLAFGVVAYGSLMEEA